MKQEKEESLNALEAKMNQNHENLKKTYFELGPDRGELLCEDLFGCLKQRNLAKLRGMNCTKKWTEYSLSVRA